MTTSGKTINRCRRDSVYKKEQTILDIIQQDVKPIEILEVFQNPFGLTLMGNRHRTIRIIFVIML